MKKPTCVGFFVQLKKVKITSSLHRQLEQLFQLQLEQLLEQKLLELEFQLQERQLEQFRLFQRLFRHRQSKQ